MAAEHYDDLEHLQACFDGWDTELIQLGRGHSAAWTSVALLPATRIVRVHAGRALVIRGTASLIDDCLILSESLEMPVRVLGQPIDASRFALTGRGARIDMFLPSNATLCLIGAKSIGRVAPRRLQIHTATAECVSTLVRFAESATDSGVQLRDSINEALEQQLRMTIENSAATTAASSGHNLRAVAVARACRFIDSHLGKCITVADLSRHCGVGVRTLEYGFRQLYDTTPISFLKRQRLSRIHGALLQQSATTSIRQIATRLGFTHMGQFAQDYRLLFGESPSATLQRARQRFDADRTHHRDEIPPELRIARRRRSQQLLQRARGPGS